MHRMLATTLALLFSLTGNVVAAEGDCVVPPPGEPAASVARTDHAVSGNRIAYGCGPLDGQVNEVALGGTPAWILPDPTDRGRSWLVALEDGTIEHVIDEAGHEPRVSQSGFPPLALGHPPLAAAPGPDQLVVGSAFTAADSFEAPLPDARVTEIGGEAWVALTAPTDRYPHGVLGDAYEAAAIDVRDVGGLLVRIEVAETEVIEGTSAMVVELVPSIPGPELLVTISDADDGARLRAYGLDGAIVAESDPIGQGFRWLHQIGAAPLGPDGETEVVVVRTPHIGGVVEAYRLDGRLLRRVAALGGYSSHGIGSANLDMGALADVTGDGRLEVVVPSQDRRSLGVLARTGDGFEEVERLPLDGELVTNLAATPDESGRLVLAVGTDEGRLRVFR